MSVERPSREGESRSLCLATHKANSRRRGNSEGDYTSFGRIGSSTCLYSSDQRKLTVVHSDYGTYVQDSFILVLDSGDESVSDRAYILLRRVRNKINCCSFVCDLSKMIEVFPFARLLPHSDAVLSGTK